MKVFMCKISGNYRGGLVVVAANSKEEAFKVFFEKEEYDWMVWKCDEDYQIYEDTSKWHSDYYPLENWFECEMLIANVDKPCVIMEGSYIE